MSTSAHFDKEARDALVKGINLVANAVKTTLGYAGNTVVIQREDKTPLITKDGVSVAKEILPKDEKVKLGSDLAIAVAQKQLDSVGDGTTTATVIAQAIVNNGVRQLELSDSTINRTKLRQGIEKATNSIVKDLKAWSTEITDNQQLYDIATVSANGDAKLGKVVADAYLKVGKDGVVTVEETKDRDIRLEFKEGMTFDRGWTSQFFVNNREDQIVEFDKPMILLCNSKISNFQTLANIIQDVLQRQQPLVIIAEGFDTSVTQALAMNIIRTGGAMKIACVEAPSYGDNRLNRLRDMAIYLGAEVADDPLGIKFETMTSMSFGSCDKIIIKKDETIIRGGHGDEAKIKARVEALQGEIKATKENDSSTLEILNKRLAALTTGVALIQVGGSSEEEIKELKDRLDDATWAVKAALEEGYLPGGGTTLLRLADKLLIDLPEDEDMATGVKVFANALRAPFKTIVENAGLHYDVIVKDVLKDTNKNVGYNVATHKVADMLEDGIIDPTKVVVGTVYAASSIASVALTADVVVTVDPVEKEGVSLNMVPGGMPMM